MNRSLNAARRLIAPAALLVSLVAASVGTATAGVIRPTTERIVGVTVFQDSAEVVREARVTVPAGVSTIEFAPLPREIDTNALRVRIREGAASLSAADIRDIARESVAPSDVSEIEARLESLQEQIDSIAGEARVDSDLLAYLRALRATATEGVGQAMGSGSIDVASLEALYGMLGKRFSELKEREIARVQRKKELVEDRELRKAQLDALGWEKDHAKRAASVQIDSPAGGDLTLILSYMVHDAGWNPRYRAALDAEGKGIELTLEGVVWQSSGEDWENVKLHFSTSDPARSVSPPLLLSSRVAPKHSYAGESMEREREFKMAIAGVSNVDPLTREFSSYTHADSIDEVVVLSKSQYSVSFSPRSTQDLRSNAGKRRIMLRRDVLPAQLVYKIAPGATSNAYLMALTRSPAEYPLIPGHLDIFIKDAYVGRTVLGETSPGVDLKIPFGADNRVMISNLAETGSDARRGFGQRNRQQVHRERYRLQNVGDDTASIIYESRHPVAKDERIQIDVNDDVTTPGWNPSEKRPGVMRWKFDLAPGETKEMRLEYEIKHPTSLEIVTEGATAN